jgi:hypothetical protein
MPTIVNKNLRKNRETQHPLDCKFDTVEEAAQAKTEYVWNNVLKNVDWDKLDQIRKKK